MIVPKLNKIYLVIVKNDSKIVKISAFKREISKDIRSKKESAFIRLSNFLKKNYPAKQHKFYLVGLNRPEIFSVLEFKPGTNSSAVSDVLSDTNIIFDLDSKRIYNISSVRLG